ncbi:MAG: hypothetical protein HYY20_02735 [Candidatus Tectomicrobia bacterium]|uniref:Cytochrome b/b6 C-terminal region profile domain-containing protein n=1 Tax=Tectimicrobiota bacterium TaxID=2528274 RepID=A0A932CMB6_UNCTE|nr:hypothetical protein [Candidatus Tectomicrobia bacterium]
MKYTRENWNGETEPFWPNDIVHKGIILSIVLGLFFAIAFFGPGIFLPLEEPANPLETPLHIKPEWYFIASYATLKLIPSELLGIGLQVFALLALLLLPFWDRGPEQNPLKRRLFLSLVGIGTLTFIGLTIWGYLS